MKKLELNTKFILPPNLDRKAGFEFEYSNVKLPIVASAFYKEYGGIIEMINPYYYKLKNSRVGDFKFIIDAQFLVNSKLQDLVKKIGIEEFLPIDFIQKIEEFIALVGENLVPYEVTTPPIAFKDINEAQNIKEILRKLGAHGTKKSLLYAFGMHINIEAKSLDIKSILSDLRSYFTLYEFIYEWLKPDLTRRVSPYINPFDTEYILLILDKSYNPTMSEFIDDYITYNPTRNRSLDLLPLLTWIDEQRVRAKLPDEKISKRPTYHYRLPDSRVDEKDWCVCDGFNSWMLVELLSKDSKSLDNLSQVALKYYSSSPLSILFKDELLEEINRWVESL